MKHKKYCLYRSAAFISLAVLILFLCLCVMLHFAVDRFYKVYTARGLKRPIYGSCRFGTGGGWKVVLKPGNSRRATLARDPGYSKYGYFSRWRIPFSHKRQHLGSWARFLSPDADITYCQQRLLCSVERRKHFHHFGTRRRLHRDYTTGRFDRGV